METEKRTFSGIETKGREISGYAIVFNEKSEILRENGRRFREIILPGAVTEELIRQSDVRCYIDHDHGRLVARSNKGKGSLHLSIDSKGLRFSFSAPKTADGDFAVEMVSRGDITGCSFAFAGVTDTWTEGQDGIFLRKISKIASLSDVSLVQTPAYPQTSVGVRAKKTNNNMEKRNIKDILPNWADVFRSEVSTKLLKEKANIRVEKSARGRASYPFIHGAAPTIDRIPVPGAVDASVRIVNAEPKTIYTKIDVSTAAAKASPELYQGAIREVARLTAETINKWIVSPTKIVDVENVQGVFVKEESDANVTTFAGEVPTWEEIVQLETLTLSTVGADETGLYVVHPSMAHVLKTTPKATGSEMMMDKGIINNYPVYVTTDVPEGFVGFGFFSNVVVNEFDTLDIIKDSILRATEYITVIHCNYEADVAVLREKAFAAGYTPTANAIVYP